MWLTSARFDGLQESGARSAMPIIISSSYTPAQLAAMSVAQLNALTTKQFASFKAAQIDALSPDQLNGLSAANFAAINVAYLTEAQIVGLTTALGELTAKQAAKLTTADISYLSASQFSSLSGAVLSAFSASQAAAISAVQISAISTSAVATLTDAFLNRLSRSQIGAFTKDQVAAMTSAQIGGLSSSAFAAMNLALFGAQQIAGLTASEVGGLSLANFDNYVAPSLGSLSVAAVKGLTVAELSSLTPAEAASFSSTQLAAMSAAQLAALSTPSGSNADYNAVMNDVSAHLSGGTLTFAAAQTILEDAASGGMSAGKFAALQAVAKEINAGGASSISASAMVQQLFDDVVLGNSANAHWNGGSSTATALGNLSAKSTQTQVDELIGKWFLGTDDPSLAGSPITAVYQLASGNLFSSAGPLFTDVNQGEVGDCYFEAALAETALQDPSLIRNMITSDGNGVYTVDFQLNGQNDYVTVDMNLANMQGGYQWSDGSTLEFDNGGVSGALWSAIVEKAYVEFRAQTDGVNSYSNISGGWDNGLTAITGQSVTDYFASDYTSASSITSLLDTLGSAFSSDEDVLMSTIGDDSALNLVGDHMYAVIGVNVAAGTVTLDNPWNANGAGSGVQMQFTEPLSALLADGVTFHVAAGAPAVA
jgi:hypothetical protein